jgi:hypothetical protein
MDGFATENYDNAGKTSQGDRNLRGRAEGFTRFHSWMTSAVHGEFWKHFFFRPFMHHKVTSSSKAELLTCRKLLP